MRTKSLLILIVLSLVVLAAGCQGVARVHENNHHRAISQSNVIYSYRGPGITEYDRVRLAMSIGEPYFGLPTSGDEEDPHDR